MASVEPLPWLCGTAWECLGLIPFSSLSVVLFLSVHKVHSYSCPPLSFFMNLELWPLISVYYVSLFISMMG